MCANSRGQDLGSCRVAATEIEMQTCDRVACQPDISGTEPILHDIRLHRVLHRRYMQLDTRVRCANPAIGPKST